MMTAAFTQTPELALEADESKPLAEAVAELAKHYDIPGLDAKAMAWVGLVMVAGKIYVPRAILIKARLDEEARSKPKARPTIAVDNTKERREEKPAETTVFDGLHFDPLNPPII